MFTVFFLLFFRQLIEVSIGPRIIKTFVNQPLQVFFHVPAAHLHTLRTVPMVGSMQTCWPLTQHKQPWGTAWEANGGPATGESGRIKMSLRLMLMPLEIPEEQGKGENDGGRSRNALTEQGEQRVPPWEIYVLIALQAVSSTYSATDTTIPALLSLVKSTVL